jgi:hypothetical protein
MAAIRSVDPETGVSRLHTGIDHREAINGADSALRGDLEALYATENPANVGYVVDGVFHNRPAGLEALRAMRRGAPPPPRETVLEALRRQMEERPRRTMSFSPERVDDMLNKWGERTKTRYAATVAPDEFLGVTSSPERIRQIVQEELQPLDERRLSLGDSYIHGLAEDTPMLLMEVRNGRAAVNSHEGRHRGAASALEGVRDFPIVLQPGSWDMEPFLRGRKSVTLLPDRNAGAQLRAVVRNLTAVRPENREALLRLGGKRRSPNHITLGIAAALASLLSQQEDETA